MKPEELESFLSKATPYHFTIENTCDELANATINLESLNAGAEKQLNDEYIDAILYETDYHTNLNSQKQLNESMYNDENKVIKNSLHAYQLYNFVLQKGETKCFNLLLYMDPNTPMETANMNATWKGKITLSANYKEEPTANLNGLKVPLVEEGDGLYAVSHDVSEISSDWNKTEYRYAGANVNNYVSFNNEKWQIIGLVNVQTKKRIEQRIKIVRSEILFEQDYLGEYEWDEKDDESSINDWTQASLKDMLNGIYYESSLGACKKDDGTYHLQNSCDFTGTGKEPKGLNDIARNMIDKEVIWNLGGSSDSKIVTEEFYERERGTSTFENKYPAIWNSETNNGNNFNGIGLFYPSDYGYSVAGNIRNVCLSKILHEWDDDDDCRYESWISDSYSCNISLLTISTSSDITSDGVFSIDSSGYVGVISAIDYQNIVPALYLKPTVKITTNPHPEQEYGTVDNPFQLSQSGM